MSIRLRPVLADGRTVSGTMQSSASQMRRALAPGHRAGIALRREHEILDAAFIALMTCTPEGEDENTAEKRPVLRYRFP